MIEDSSALYTSPFDAICSIDEDGNECWSARELHKILGYTEWRNFNRVVINRAMKACEENGQAISDHFVRSYKMVSREPQLTVFVQMKTHEGNGEAALDHLVRSYKVIGEGKARWAYDP